MCDQIQDPLFKDQWNLKLMNVPEAWKYSTGKGVVVGIIDSGVDPTHQDLGWDTHIKLSADDTRETIRLKTERVRKAIANEIHTKILPGWNFLGSNSCTFDFYRHGTYMAGIIAADRDNIGIVGVAPDCKIRPYVILDSNGSGNQDDLAEAINKAVNDGCDVINMSLAWSTCNSTVQDAVDKAVEAGAILIAAAGNDDIEKIMYPAKYDNVIAVGACGQQGDRWWHSEDRGSNWGKELFCVCPGAAQPTTQRLRSRWTNIDATSAAAANMSGVVALVKGIDKTIDISKFETLMIDHCLYDTDWNKYLGWGVPDAAKMVKVATLEKQKDYKPPTKINLGMFISKIDFINNKLENLRKHILEFIEEE